MAEYHRKKKSAQSGPDPLYAFFDALFRALWWIASLPFKGKGQNQRLVKAKVEISQHWQEVERLLSTGQEKQAILTADTLLDHSLQVLGYSGNSLGERLKSAQKYLSQEVLDTAWRAHKIRNQIAHELQYTISAPAAAHAVADFRRVIKSLGLL